MAIRTLIDLLETSAEKFSGNILLWEKKDDAYQGETYSQIRDRVHTFAAGLLSCGIEKGDRIALISEGRNDWVVTELGIVCAGAINVPMSVKLEELSDLKFRLSHAECKMVVVSRSQLPKIQQIVKDLPKLQLIISLDPVEKDLKDLITLQNLLEKGKHYLSTSREKLQERLDEVKEDDSVNICYTSGTTADPKGIVLTHRNYTSNVEQASAMLPIKEEWTSLVILPWDHSFAHTCAIYTLMRNGASMASIQVGKTPMETLKNIPQNIKEIRPTFLLSVPSLAQNFRKNIEKGIRQKGPKVEKLFKAALNNAVAYNADGWNRGKGLRILRKPLYLLHDKILFSKIRENFGARLEFFIGGGALLDIELQRFFYAIGMPMYQGYGLTEASPVISANVPKKHKLGSSGFIVPDLDIKICNDKGEALPIGEKGEIVVKGENVMKGYWKNERATKETIRDGWLFTGDIGYLDEDNFLYVLGREKSLLISNDGEKYSPEGIEEALVSSSEYIDQIMLYNDQSAYTIALIVPNRVAVTEQIKSRSLDHTTEEGQKAVIELFESDIKVFREGGEKEGIFPSKWLPATFALLGEGFTEQNRFLNSTLKMVRNRIVDFYKTRIEELHTPEGKNIYNSENLKIVSRLLD